MNTPTRRIMLWRHGRSVWNVERRFQGQADVPLDEIGRAQAKTAAYHLAAAHPDVIVSSDLSRAYDTAVELSLLSGLSIEPDSRLREGSVGHWEGLTREEVAERFPEEYAEWMAGRMTRHGGGELRSEVALRAAAVVDAIAAETAVLVTHSATISVLIGHLLGLPESAWRLIVPPSNGHWSELVLDKSSWRLRSHNVGAVMPKTPPVPTEVAAAEKVAGEASDAEALLTGGGSSARS